MVLPIKQQTEPTCHKITEKRYYYACFSSLLPHLVILIAMFRYGKQSRQAVSAMSYLAEKYAPDAPLVSSGEVGRERNISVALAAKLLSQMATAGLTVGLTGPGGGYRLARPPGKIRLSQIVSLFERRMDEFPCPIGQGSCGTGDHDQCPLHNDFARLEEDSRLFLENTTLSVFTNKLAAGRKIDKSATGAGKGSPGKKRVIRA